MQVEEELARVSPDRETVLSIGVFDGVHLGHKHLLSQLIEQARERNLLAGVVTFRQHPEEVVLPGTRLPFLTDSAERSNLLQRAGVDTVITLSFTRELAQLDARRFIGLLQQYLKMRGMVIGPDFALGRNREGNLDTILRLGEEMGFTVTMVPPLLIDGEVVSSTAIRGAILAGDMRKVNRFAGRPFKLHGQVVAGAGRGAGLGFPTANLDIDPEQALPADGVYAGWAYIDGKAYPSLTNIGNCPTFDGSERTAEAYLIDYQGDLYGRELRVEIIERLRDEVKFGDAEELKQQMAEDVRRGRVVLESGSRNELW